MQISTRIGVVHAMAFSLSTAVDRQFAVKTSLVRKRRKGGLRLQQHSGIGVGTQRGMRPRDSCPPPLRHHGKVIGYNSRKGRPEPAARPAVALGFVSARRRKLLKNGGLAVHANLPQSGVDRTCDIGKCVTRAAL